mmetsp:Transcript_31570/g.62897  ORF Transcript_31570/g.62897 Transcript_31570/m.62897 type:complete len:290 (-) Transcript_31570:405-1274(-)
MVVISLGPFPYRGWMMFTTPSSHLQKIQMNQRIHSCRSSRFRFRFCRSFHFHSYHSFHCFPMRAQVHTIRRYPIHGPIRESDHIHTRRGSIQPKACLQRTTFQTSPKTYQICLTSPWIPFQIFQWSPYRTFRMRKNHCNRRRRHRHRLQVVPNVRPIQVQDMVFPNVHPNQVQASCPQIPILICRSFRIHFHSCLIFQIHYRSCRTCRSRSCRTCRSHSCQTCRRIRKASARDQTNHRFPIRRPKVRVLPNRPILQRRLHTKQECSRHHHHRHHHKKTSRSSRCCSCRS